MQHDIKLRTVFDEEALLYHKARPRYPKELFDTLIDVTELSKDANLLEVGLGTGQATEPMAKRGYSITAVELGENLATLAEKELKGFPNVQIVRGMFENIELPGEAFDLIYFATSFQWIEPDVRFVKSHKLLKPNGHLAIIHTNHVSDEKGDIFFNATQPIYDKYRTVPRGKFQLQRADDLKPIEIDKKLFKLVLFKTFPITIHYALEEYMDLLNTYSLNRALKLEARKEFFNSLRQLIKERFGGSVDKSFAMSLTIARKI